MASGKSITALPPLPLDTRETENCRPAVSDIPRRLSAAAAWLVGYIVGGDELEDGVTPNLSPRSPMTGRRGHTHSGGLDGRPLFRSVASWTYEPSNFSGETSTNISENTHLTVMSFAVPVTASSPSQSVTLVRDTGPPMPVWVPGCDLDVGAYRRMAWQCVLRVKAGSGLQAGDEVSVRLRNLSNGLQSDSVASTIGPTGDYHLDYNDDGLVCEPGRVNIIQAQTVFAADATSSTRSLSTELIEVEIGVGSSV